jgi:hypothetical protein
MYTIYRRVGWFENYLGRKDLHGYDYSISNYILRFLTSHISSIFRYNNIWLVTTRLTRGVIFTRLNFIIQERSHVLLFITAAKHIGSDLERNSYYDCLWTGGRKPKSRAV